MAPPGRPLEEWRGPGGHRTARRPCCGTMTLSARNNVSFFTARRTVTWSSEKLTAWAVPGTWRGRRGAARRGARKGGSASRRCRKALGHTREPNHPSCLATQHRPSAPPRGHGHLAGASEASGSGWPVCLVQVHLLLCTYPLSNCHLMTAVSGDSRRPGGPDTGATAAAHWPCDSRRCDAQEGPDGGAGARGRAGRPDSLDIWPLFVYSGKRRKLHRTCI